MATLAFNQGGPASRVSIIVGTRTGGQGKTLVSQALHYHYKKSGTALKVLSADTADDGGSVDTKSKLGRFLDPKDRVEELGIGATIANIRSDPNAAVEYWSPLGLALESGNVLVDIGANIMPTIWAWAREVEAGRILEDAPPIWLVIPVTAQKQSLLDALDLIKLANENHADLPIARYFVVLNEVHGTFEDLQGTPEFQDLRKLEADGGITTIRIGRCKSSVWTKVESEFLSLEEMAALHFRDYATRFSIDRFKASGAEKDFTQWLSDTVNALAAAGLAPRAKVETDL